MKILGCFKIVPDLDLLSEEDWVVKESLKVDVSFIKSIWNCFDESALEIMLKLSDISESFNVNFQLESLTVGDARSENYCKTLYSLGFNRAVRIECEKEIQFWPEMTAKLITEYVSQKGSQDVIIMGRQSSDEDNMKTPLLVAENLKWPCLTQVIDVSPIDEEKLKITRVIDGGLCTEVVKVPVVLTIGDAPCSYLRVPTLKARMKFGKQPIEVYKPEDFNLDCLFENVEKNVELVQLKPVHKRREGIIIEGESVEEKTKILYQSYLKGRWKEL